MSNVREIRTRAQADQEDVFFGQTVILWARWSVIAAGIALVLWTSTSISHLTQNIQFFVLYFPVVFAFALVFTRRIEAAYTVMAMGAYAAACFLTGTVAFNLGYDDKVLVMRLIVIAAMGFLGNYYFRIQRDRLARASEDSNSKSGLARTPIQSALQSSGSCGSYRWASP